MASTGSIKSRVGILYDEGEKSWTRRWGFMTRVKITVISALSDEGIRDSFKFGCKDA